MTALLAGRDRPDDGGLLQHLGTRADRLSGGTARRLLLDAVLALPAAVAVLDEPADGLDDGAVRRLADVLATRLAGGGIVVVAEHRPLPLPGGTVLDLGGGRAALPAVRITLQGVGSFRGHSADGGTVILTGPPAERDALLVDAVGAGWSVLAVEPPR